MDSPKFTLGLMIGSLTFAFVMANLWVWNIVPVATMRAFDMDPHHVYMMIAMALGTMFTSGMITSRFF